MKNGNMIEQAELAKFESNLTERLRKRLPSTFNHIYAESDPALGRLNLIDTATRIENYEEQRTLILYQKRATFWIKWATIVMALATVSQVIVAICKKP